MKKTSIILFLLFFLALPIINAQPPFQEAEQTGFASLRVIGTRNTFFAKDQEIILEFNVFNSTGYERRNDTCTCSFDLHNSQGYHLIYNPSVSWNSTEDDFNQVISTNITRTRGFYTYMIECNDTASHEAGYTNGDFEITSTGKHRVENGSAGMAITLFLLVITVGMYLVPLLLKFNFASFEDNRMNSFVNRIVTRGFWVIATYFLTLNTAIMVGVAETVNLDVHTEFFTYMWIFGTAGYVLMAYWVLRIFFDLISMFSYRKGKKQRGEF